MDKLEKTYKAKDDPDNFLMDLIKHLQGQDLFYKIGKVLVEKTEKEIKYTAEIVYLSKKNVNKTYMPGKKTGDTDRQITTKAEVE